MKAFPFDYLILAPGATHSYFGHPEWAQVAPGLKTIEDATAIRRATLLAFEKAELAQTDQERKRYLSFVIVGGGPTGVEMAGAIAAIARESLQPDFRRIDAKDAAIRLIEAGPTDCPRCRQSYPITPRERWNALACRSKPRPRSRHAPQTGSKRRRASSKRRRLFGPPEWSHPQPRNGSACRGIRQAAFKPGRTCPSRHAFHLRRGRRGSGSRSIRRACSRDCACRKTDGRICGQKDCRGPSREAGPAIPLPPRGRSRCDRPRRRRRKHRPVQPGAFSAGFFWGAAHIFFLIGVRNRLQVAISWLWYYVTFHSGARLITGYEAASQPAKRDDPQGSARAAVDGGRRRHVDISDDRDGHVAQR